MRALTILALVAGTALSQSTEQTPRFDVADVNVSAHSSAPYMRGPSSAADVMKCATPAWWI